jgi:hypothetical protein
MSKQTAANFFMQSPSEAKSVELYQALLRGIGSHQQLGDLLIRLAEQAHAFRQFDQLEELALMLSQISIKDYRAVGNYFLAVATKSKRSADQDEARRLLELTVDTAPDTYKGKATLLLGALSFNRREMDSALYYLQETIKTGKLSAAGIQAIRGVAILKAIEGDHAQAVRDLENLLPVMKYAPAHIYFDLLNSYAVELGEVGRVQEAHNVSRMVLASPFTFAYPEWRETNDEINLRGYKSRSTVSPVYRHTPNNLLHLPERTASAPCPPTPFWQPGSVTKLKDWKKKMVEEPNGNDSEQLPEDMSAEDMAMTLLELITENRAEEDQMRKILEYALKVFSEPRNSA